MDNFEVTLAEDAPMGLILVVGPVTVGIEWVQPEWADIGALSSTDCSKSFCGRAPGRGVALPGDGDREA